MNTNVEFHLKKQVRMCLCDSAHVCSNSYSTYSHNLHLIQSLQSLCFGQRAAASQSFQNTIEGQQVGLNFLLTHLVQQLLQTNKETQQ